MKMRKENNGKCRENGKLCKVKRRRNIIFYDGLFNISYCHYNRKTGE